MDMDKDMDGELNEDEQYYIGGEDEVEQGGFGFGMPNEPSFLPSSPLIPHQEPPQFTSDNNYDDDTMGASWDDHEDSEESDFVGFANEDLQIIQGMSFHLGY